MEKEPAELWITEPDDSVFATASSIFSRSKGSCSKSSRNGPPGGGSFVLKGRAFATTSGAEGSRKPVMPD